MQEETTGRSHPPCCTTARDDRRVVCMAVMNRTATAQTIEQQSQSVAIHLVSACTIRRRLPQSGMSAMCLLFPLLLTRNHGC
ncbi:hypothetical protein TNCV_2866051 [Trichonephila clavipes]|nr:hypothetical protein TNCV_2866051 [Trichonephila clavipes]